MTSQTEKLPARCVVMCVIRLAEDSAKYINKGLKRKLGNLLPFALKGRKR